MTIPPLKLLEAAVTDQVRGFLEHHGWRGLRMGRGGMAVPNQYITFGEPGVPDWLFLRYAPNAPELCAAGLMLWIEFKRRGARAQCRCRSKAPRQRCTACDQKNWRERERRAGAEVWLVDDLDWFMREYERRFGWLHSGDMAMGQLDLLAEGR
jgi:hypothetical protein